MNRKTATLAAIAAALALAGGALAAPQPSVQGVAATGVVPDRPGFHRNDVSVAWSLAAGEYACSLDFSSPSAAPGPRPLGPTETSATATLDVVPGETITVTLAFASDPGCGFSLLQRAATTTTAVAYAPPAPPAEPSPPAETTPIEATSAPAPTGPTVEDRLTELEQALAAIAVRVGNLETANLAAWDAFVDALARGETTDVAALAARSAAMNALYGLG